MQRTSRAYRTEQKQYLRNEQYVYVYLGVISREAQANAHAEGGFTIYSDPQSIFGNNTFEAYYATAEENMARCNGTQFFMPRDDSFALWQGLVTQHSLGSVTFTFGSYKHLNIKGLTIDFGDYYPTSFTINNGHASYTYTYTNDEPGKWTCEDEFLDTEFIRITPHSMVGGRQKFRIHSILFGLGFLFDNTSLISTSWKSEVAHLSDSLPAKSFSFTIDNLSRKFSADNPHSFVAFLQEQQDVEFDYGRKMDDGTIYRIPGGKLRLTSWSSNDTQAKFSAVGNMDYATGTYKRGQYYPNGISLWDLAVDVCEDAGFENYIIDTYLKKVITHNPLPPEKHKNLLQLIANAARAILRETRNGQIEIKTSFKPDVVDVTSNGHLDYCDLPSIVDELETHSEYATSERDFVYADGHQFFMPRNSEESGYYKAGYISEAVSNEDGIFTGTSTNYLRFVHEDGTITGIKFDGDIETMFGKFLGDGISVNFNELTSFNPSLTVTWEAAWSFFNLTLAFSDVYPVTVVIHTFKDGEGIESFEVEDEIDIITTVNHDFYDVDMITIEFVKTNPKQRIHLDRIIFGDITNYSIDYRDMATSPTAVRTDFIHDVNVVYSEYSYGTDRKNISTLSSIEDENTSEFKTAYHDYSLAYKELTDDEQTYSKASKIFCDELPDVESAKSNTWYFLRTGSGYDAYKQQTVDQVKSWELQGSFIEEIVSTLPNPMSENVIYMVETDKDLIYHLYIVDISNEERPTISLGYDVRGTLTITDSGAYFVSFTTDVLSPVVISGIEFLINESTYTTELNEIGLDKTASNVLIDNLDLAKDQSEWLSEYFKNDVEYKIQYRGEPALDPDDQIYIENKFVEKNLIRVTDTQINTSMGMSMNCTITGRRISYTEPARVDYARVDISEVAE